MCQALLTEASQAGSFLPVDTPGGPGDWRVRSCCTEWFCLPTRPENLSRTQAHLGRYEGCLSITRVGLRKPQSLRI